METDLSIIAPLYNRAEMIRLCLDALACQTKKNYRFEILIIDDSSTDGSPDIVRSYCGKSPLRLLQTDIPTRSAARARKHGARHAVGKHLMFLDADIICGPSVIATHMEIRKPSENAVVLGYVNGQESTPIGFTIHFPTCFLGSVLNVHKLFSYFAANSPLLDMHRDATASDSIWLSDLPAPWAYCWTQLVSLTRSCFCNFDKSFKYKGSEDLEWAYRLHRCGCRFALSPEMATFHYPHRRDRVRDIINDRENIYRFLRKHPVLEVEVLAGFDCQHLNIALSAVVDLVSASRALPEAQENCRELAKTVMSKNRPNLLLGAGRGGLLSTGRFKYAAVPNVTFYCEPRQLSCSVLPLIGFALPFPSESFRGYIHKKSLLAFSRNTALSGFARGYSCFREGDNVCAP